MSAKIAMLHYSSKSMQISCCYLHDVDHVVNTQERRGRANYDTVVNDAPRSSEPQLLQRDSAWRHRICDEVTLIQAAHARSA